MMRPDHFRRLDSILDAFPINRKHNDELSVHRSSLDTYAKFRVEIGIRGTIVIHEFHARNFLLNFLVPSTSLLCK